MGCLVYDCDYFTKTWFKENYDLDVRPILLSKARPNIMYQPVPKYNGYGTEEDSLGSVYQLQPKPPRLDMKKMFKQDMHVLRFEAKLVSTELDDENRKFIISFYFGDDSI